MSQFIRAFQVPHFVNVRVWAYMEIVVCLCYIRCAHKHVRKLTHNDYNRLRNIWCKHLIQFTLFHLHPLIYNNRKRSNPENGKCINAQSVAKDHASV